MAAPAFAYVGHTLTNTDGLNLDPNDLSTQALITTSHALVGGTIAELSGGEFSSGAVATAVGHVVGEYVLKGGYADSAIRGELTTEDAKLQIETISQAVAGATVLLTQENVSQEELDRATSMATSVVENNSLKDFDAYVAFGKSIFTGAGEQVWEDVKSLAGALASPKETYNALKELVTSPEAIAQLGEDTYKEITDKLDYIGEVLLSDTEYGNTEASLAGAKTGEILLLVAESVGGIKGLTTGAKVGVKGAINGIKKLGNGKVRVDLGGGKSVEVPEGVAYDNKGIYDPDAVRTYYDNKVGTDNVSSTTNPKNPQQASATRGDVIIDANGNKAVQVVMPDGSTKSIPYDNRGLPIFDDVSEFTTKIDDSKSSRGQMRQASRDMWDSIKDDPRAKSKFTQTQLDDMQSGSERIDGFTWHHNAQSSPHNMQLVPSNIHNGTVPHTGQVSLKDGK